MSRITFVLAELNTRTLAEIGYQTASGYLRELRYLPIFSIHHALQAEECEMRLNWGREEEAASTTKEMLHQFHPCEIEHIEELLQKYDSGLATNRVVSMILYRRLYELHQGSYKLALIRRLAKNIRVLGHDVAGEREHTSIHVAKKYGAMFAKRMLCRLDEIANAEDIEMNNTRVECLYAIGNIYFRTEDYQSSAEYIKRSIHISSGIRRHNDSEDNFERHCIMPWILGNCHYRMRNFDDAAVCYAETVEELGKHFNIAEKWMKIAERDLVKALFRFGETPINVDTILTPAPNTEEILRQIELHSQRKTVSSAMFVANAEIGLCRGQEDASLQKVRDEIHRSRYDNAECIRMEGDKLDIQYKEQRIPALLMYRNAFDMYLEEEHTPHDTAKWIGNLAQEVFLASYSLAAEDKTSAGFAITYGATLVEDLLYYLHSIGDRALRDLKFADAECIFYLANIFFRTGIYDTSALHFETAVQLLEELYQENVYQNKHYCLSLWIAGNCRYRMRQYKEAERWYSKTVEALTMSTASIRGNWLRIAVRDLGKAIEKQKII